MAGSFSAGLGKGPPIPAAGLTSQHGRLLGRGHPQALRWPSLAPWGQLLLLHATEGCWGGARQSREPPGQGLAGVAHPILPRGWGPGLQGGPDHHPAKLRPESHGPSCLSQPPDTDGWNQTRGGP